MIRAPGYTQVGRASRFSATRSSVSMCWKAGGRTDPAAGTMSARWSVIWFTTWGWGVGWGDGDSHHG